jgi:hypothetical protein
MSAFGSKADTATDRENVAFEPKRALTAIAPAPFGLPV